ncbi:MAG: GAF and ANTAR domain-containing protein [Actinomycetota bacterium]|nr:GAF and ANTAR domain-containing protein [Actinomycetota bacterium]
MTGHAQSGLRPATGGTAPSEQVELDEADLNAGLADLASLVSGSLALDELLGRVASSAGLAIPGANGAGVTLLRVNQGVNIVQSLGASAMFVSEIDAIQYEVVDEGPCISAALEGRAVWSGSLGGDARWPRFGSRAGRLGVHSALSLPLMLPDDTVVGALNAYARAKDAFDEHAAQLGLLFAAPAAVAVHNAQVLAQAQTRAAQLQAALGSRAVIDQAIGILRSRSGGSADEAFARLREISQGENVKLSAVAQHIVEEAVRRAQARHTKSE